MEEGGSRDCGDHLKLRQVEGRVEKIERAVAHLEEIHVLGIDRVFVVADDKHAGVRLSPNQKVHDAAVQELLRREEIQRLFHVGALGPVHAAFADAQTGRIRQNRAFHREFRPVGK